MVNGKDFLENRLIDLGDAIDLLRNGQNMSYEQLKLINDATGNQVQLAIMVKAASTLKGHEYTNYCHNVKTLSKIKKQSKKTS